MDGFHNALDLFTMQAPTLKITQSIEFPSDARSDEMTLQLLVCTECPFKDLAAYQKSRSGASDHVGHLGYLISQTLWKTIEKMILVFPAPQQKNCSCATHQTLGQTHNHYWVSANELIQDIEPNIAWKAAVMLQGIPLHFKH